MGKDAPIFIKKGWPNKRYLKKVSGSHATLKGQQISSEGPCLLGGGAGT